MYCIRCTAGTVVCSLLQFSDAATDVRPVFVCLVAQDAALQWQRGEQDERRARETSSLVQPCGGGALALQQPFPSAGSFVCSAAFSSMPFFLSAISSPFCQALILCSGDLGGWRDQPLDELMWKNCELGIRNVHGRFGAPSGER